MSVRAALIGCGKRGVLHARGLLTMEEVELAGCVDLAFALAEQLATQHPGPRPFADIDEMLREVKPDLAVICTRPQARLDPIRRCVEAGVRAIQCEKPMATSWDEARRIHRVCEQGGVQLTFTHQRRFRADFTVARRLLAENAIGAIERIEGLCPNLYDWGTHWFDMAFFLAGDIDARWVMGQADFADSRRVFDAPVEGRGVSVFELEDGVLGLLLTGPRDGADTGMRVLGESGVMEVFPHGPRSLRLLRAGGGGAWEQPPLQPEDGPLEHADAVTASLAHTVDCLQSGASPLHGGDKALKATELIFATYASAKRNLRIELPMGDDDELELERLFA